MNQPDPTLTAAIHDAVQRRRDDIVALLLDLVAASSITGDEREVQRRVRAAYETSGLAVDQWEATPEEIAPYLVHVGEQPRYTGRPNLVATRAGAGDGRSIMLQGHVDTVDPGDPALWTRNPAGEATADRVYGRGAADMKGGIVTNIAALDVFADLGVTLNGDVMLAASVGEEDGGLGALSTILRGHRADAVVITEPTELNVVIAQGGSLVFRITITGRSAHGASRNEGVSAVEKFIPIFQDLLAWEAERNATLSHPLYDHLENKFPISVGLVRAGTWASTVPELLVAEGRLGFLPGESIDDMMRQAEDRIRTVADQDPWLRKHPPVVDWFGGQFASAEVSPDEPIAVAVGDAHAAATGERATIAGVPYGADMRLFTEIGRMPAIMYGAGSAKNVHCPDEFIEIDELLTAVETIAHTLVRWCGASPQEIPAP